MNKITGLLVYPDGLSEFVDMPPTLESFWRAVGNWVEVITPDREAPLRDWHAYCDEEGRTRGLATNAYATRLAQAAGWPGTIPLVGPVLFVGSTSANYDTGLSREFVKIKESVDAEFQQSA